MAFKRKAQRNGHMASKVPLHLVLVKIFSLCTKLITPSKKCHVMLSSNQINKLCLSTLTLIQQPVEEIALYTYLVY